MALEIQLSPLLLPYAVASLLTAGVALYAAQRLRTTGWDPLIVTFIGIAVGAGMACLGRFAVYLFVDEAITHFWITVVYVGYGLTTMSGLLFSLVFTGRSRFVNRRTVALLFIIPTIGVILVATNPVHNIFWTLTFEHRSGWWGNIDVIRHEFEPVYYVYLSYVIGGALVGIGLLLRMAYNSPDVYRRQTAAFTVGAFAPIILGVSYATGTTPVFPEFIDLTEVGFGIMGLCFGYAIFRHRMLDLVPVARDTVIEHMRDGYIVLDTADRIVDLNNAAVGFLDSDGDVVGQTVHSAFPPATDLIDDHEHGSRTEAELTVDVAGDQRYLLTSVSSLRDNDDLIGRLLFLRDVTEQRAIRKRYQALIENSSDLTLVVDEDGEITYASPSVTKITGANPEDVEGTDGFEFVHEDDREEFRDHVEELIDNPGAKSREEYRTLNADGEWIYLEASVWNLLDNPFVEGIVVNAREITERKEREEEIKEKNSQLEEANQQLEQFASVISHDLRNPINVARGHLDLAEETGREESFEKIGDSLQRMEAIIDDVLTLAREGESIGETEEVSLEERAELAWEHVATEEAELVVNDDAHFQADPDRLLQLFENLFRNSHEHVGEDVQVTVGFDNGALYVEDDGPGIPDDRKDKVLESGHTTNEDGTGLGLSIVTQIAEAHEWDVQVADGSTGGARFEFPGIGKEEESEAA